MGMGLLLNIFLMLILVIIIIVLLLHHQKTSTNNNLEDCFDKCNNNCDKNHPASYYDVCKKKCAISCGNNSK